MFVKKTLRTMLLSLTALGSLAATAAAEVDHYPGAMCEQMWTSIEKVHRSDGTLYNPSRGIAILFKRL